MSTGIEKIGQRYRSIILYFLVAVSVSAILFSFSKLEHNGQGVKKVLT